MSLASALPQKVIRHVDRNPPYPSPATGTLRRESVARPRTFRAQEGKRYSCYTKGNAPGLPRLFRSPVSVHRT